ncbi:unnamed protein product [Soboliphyme baturini]|uniref:SH3 domain-containing protein n=1 Tax=Soboliphyme baturini TaxID=241478 RepID=A0A183JA96_9BILA|nr:unnamed protein product [Soboliphyme baturini]
MQSLRGDAGYSFRSLDDIYYYGGQQEHLLVAVYPHSPKAPFEIELREGDLISIAGNHWDGFSLGTNKRTGHTGVFPSFKARERWKE